MSSTIERALQCLRSGFLMLGAHLGVLSQQDKASTEAVSLCKDAGEVKGSGGGGHERTSGLLRLPSMLTFTRLRRPARSLPSTLSRRMSPEGRIVLRAHWLRAGAAVLAFSGLTCLFIVLTWFMISVKTGSGAELETEAPHHHEEALSTGDINSFYERYSNGLPTMKRLCCAAFVALIGFWAGVGAGASHPIRSALLAAL